MSRHKSHALVHIGFGMLLLWACMAAWRALKAYQIAQTAQTNEGEETEKS